jgi:hypothetical protein
MEHQSNFSEISKSVLDVLVAQQAALPNFNSENWGHVGQLLDERGLASHLSISDRFVTTVMYGDSYVIDREKGLKRAICEAFLVDKFTNDLSVAKEELEDDDILEHIFCALKTDPLLFAKSWHGLKPYELRLNDRNYRVDDLLLLKETTHSGQAIAAGEPLCYTGRWMLIRITDVLQGQGLYGLQADWVTMSVETVRTGTSLPAEVEKLGVK